MKIGLDLFFSFIFGNVVLSNINNPLYILQDVLPVFCLKIVEYKDEYTCLNMFLFKETFQSSEISLENVNYSL